jgi:multidrug efflux pump subunit AcrA (membrane-fusion protein)
MIRSKAVDLGQYVRAGTPVAVLTGTDRGEVVVPLSLQELSWLRIPRRGESGGSPATVRLAAGPRTAEWPARLMRSLGEVDAQGRMARIVLAVEDPYGLARRRPERPDLAVGAFVHVVLHGRTEPDLAVLPAAVLREGDEVWVMDGDRLSIREVEVVHRERDEVLIGKGLAAGERVILTHVPGAAEGMKLRQAEE